MALLLEDLVQSIELWLRITKKQQPIVNPNLDPVLLVPGIAGSILHAVDDAGNEERVWVRIIGADQEFRTKLWSRFDPSTGKTLSVDQKTRIVVPEDRYGLYAIDCLDPDMIIGRESVCYYHDLIEEMIKWGYQEGKTLFGFGYDFRQSNRLQETLDRFSAKLESAYTSSGGKKLNIITHSMGGLLVKCFMCLHREIFEKYVKSWIAIAAPFQGAPGYVTTSLLNGASFVEGWEENFFISKWTMHQLLVECPSIYELMGSPDFSWDKIPFLDLWRERNDGCGHSSVLLESYKPMETLSIINDALSSNMVSYDGLQLPLPFNFEILKWAAKTREILSCAKLPESVKFYSIYGTSRNTPHSICYGSKAAPISNLNELLPLQAKYICVDGDGTVPVESARADGLDAVARVGVSADHRGIVRDRHVFRILRHWLKAGEPDPFYNPLNDYVILPTEFQIARHFEQGKEVTSVTEEWEIISSNDNDVYCESAQLSALAADLTVSCGGKELLPHDEALATVVVHPQTQGKQQHVQAAAVGLVAPA